jgi:hypothetical protein
VTKHLRDVDVLASLVTATRALVDNPNLFLEPYVRAACSRARLVDRSRAADRPTPSRPLRRRLCMAAAPADADGADVCRR